ncbi:MAG: SUF system NifU family Fe-S cluster assembly protein [Microthrixaceae bacterium]
MSDLEELYREIILDHYRSPRNRGELETPPAHRTEGFNPLCGDEVIVYLQLDDPSKGDDAVITEIRMGGQGCSISQSSGSMMSAAVSGKTIGEVRELTKAFKSMMSIHEESLDDGEKVVTASLDDDDTDDPELNLGELAALRGVVKFPVRIKCATLGWNTLSQAIRESVEV